MSHLDPVQFSQVSESEVGKFFTIRSDGRLEVAIPATDDERRDMELHLKEHFRLCLALQIKARHVLVRRNRAELLEIRFDEKKARLIANPFFWYFFGYMDLETMQYRAPVFLIPSAVVHRDADPRPHGDMIRFTFSASMDPASKDRWRPYACDPAEAALRVVKFLEAQDRKELKAELISLAPAIRQPGTILIARA